MAFTIARGAHVGHVARTVFLLIAHPRVVVPLDCGPAPMDRCAMAGNASEMNRYHTPLADDASALLAAATRLRDDASDPVSVASALADVEEALRVLSVAIEHAAHALIPPGSIGESVSRRYARAAASWPRHSAPPSYERQVQILTALHEAGATLRGGAERCRRARDILASTVA